MAGIGFRIERIMLDDSYIASFKAHIYSTLICSGPWLLSVISILSLTYFAPKSIDAFQLIYFRADITYIFAFSLIVAGVFYLSLSRYLADRLYFKEEEALIPAFNSAALLLFCILTISGYFIFFGKGEPLILSLLSVLLYLTIGLTWFIMIFLTTLRDYRSIFIAYLFGIVVAICASLFLGGIWGLKGYLAGYLLGYFIIVVLLSLRIFLEFRSRRVFDWEIFRFLARNKILVFTGVFYNMAIWIDKMVFWISPRAIQISPLLRSFADYEIATFFAYFTIIPALSIFLIHVETSFYKKYHAFYTQILEKGTYAVIRQAKLEMISSLRSGIMRLLLYQAMVTLMAIAFAPELISILDLNPILIPVFRIASLGAYLHGLLFIAIIIILYFDFKKLALSIAGLFLLSNGIFTYISAKLETCFLGYGYFFACFFSLIAAFYFLNYKLKRLEYLTFALQPLGVHREEEII